MSTDQRTVEQAPFCYRVEDWRDRHRGIARTLVAAVEIARAPGHGMSDPDHITIFACYLSGDLAAREETVPIELVARRRWATREEALAFIKDREQRIAEATGEGERALVRLMGAFRCNPDDPMDRQVDDYIESSPWEWMAPEEIADAETHVVEGIAGAAKKG